MMLVEFFKYFEEKYNVALTVFQKRAFIKALETNKTVYVSGMRSSKNVLQTLYKEYQEYKKEYKKNGKF